MQVNSLHRIEQRPHMLLILHTHVQSSSTPTSGFGFFSVFVPYGSWCTSSVPTVTLDAFLPTDPDHWLVRVTHLQVPVIRTTRILALLFAWYHLSESWPWTQIQTQYLKLPGQREVWGWNGYPEAASVPSSLPVLSKSEEDEEHNCEYWIDPLVKLDIGDHPRSR